MSVISRMKKTELIRGLIKNVASTIYALGIASYGRSNIFLTQDQIKYTERKIAFAKIATVTGHLHGDYLEFGVYRGDSLLLAHNYISGVIGDKNCRFFGFDSFKGLPEVTVESDYEAGWRQGDLVAEFEEVYKRISKVIPAERFYLIKGFFESTLTPKLREEKGIRKAKMVMIDCDIYSSTKVALEFCDPLLDAGSVIIFDDYYYNSGDPKVGGEAKAFAEFLEGSEFIAHPYCSYGFGGQSFILHKE